MKAAAFVAFSMMMMISGRSWAGGTFDGTWKTDTQTAHLPTKPDIFLLQNGEYTCKSCVPSFSVKADGMLHTVYGNPYFDSLAMKIVDAGTFQVMHARGGEVISQMTMKISPDGRSLTGESLHSNAATARPEKGHLTAFRVADGPPGSAALSGSWMIASLAESDDDNTFTLKVAGNVLAMSTPTGHSYVASLDGTKAAYLGDPGLTSVRVRKLGADTIEETDFRNGVMVGVIRMTLSADGKVLTTESIDKLRGLTRSSKAYRQ